MEVLYPRCAGLDVHKDSVVACVRCVSAPKAHEVRTFGTTTRELLALHDWLQSHGCTHVAMEATGVYWKPVWHVLEADFALVLANAQHVRNVPGRKTDVSDAMWIADLLAHGLIRCSFVPPAGIQALRDLTRTRKQLVREIGQHTLRIQKAFEDANIKVASVLTNILGRSGRTMTIAGNLTSVVQVGDPFVILPTVGVDPATAALYTSTLGTDARSVWAGYFHLSPVIEASGDNLAGEEYAWNRLFLPGAGGHFGAWSTPDPAATPWTNLQEYVWNRPVGSHDRVGLTRAMPRTIAPSGMSAMFGRGMTGPAGQDPEPQRPPDRGGPTQPDGPCCCVKDLRLNTSGAPEFVGSLADYPNEQDTRRPGTLGADENWFPWAYVFKFQLVGETYPGLDTEQQTPAEEPCSLSWWARGEFDDLDGKGVHFRDWFPDPQEHGFDANRDAEPVRWPALTGMRIRTGPTYHWGDSPSFSAHWRGTVKFRVSFTSAPGRVPSPVEIA